MDRFTLQTFADAEAVSQAAARAFVRCAIEAITDRGRFTVALSGGSTPKRLYQILAEPPYRDTVTWSKIQFFWGDERAVPPEHADSNYLSLKDALLPRVTIPKENIHRVPAEWPDHDGAARDYQAEIARVFGVNPDGEPPVFDLVFLGMGPDGHTASLFPGNPALRETTHWVVPVANAPKPPPDRLTLTRPILNKAREVLFLVTGADKADRVLEVLSGPADPMRLPSQLIRPTTGQLVWYLDRAAAGRLTAGIDGAEGKL
jgi:6-phosphogluconolactonase